MYEEMNLSHEPTVMVGITFGSAWYRANVSVMGEYDEETAVDTVREAVRSAVVARLCRLMWEDPRADVCVHVEEGPQILDWDAYDDDDPRRQLPKATLRLVGFGVKDAVAYMTKERAT
jgi:hypothetical protein